MIDVPAKLRHIKKAAGILSGSMERCVICPRRCAVNRAGGKKGYCRAPSNPVVYSYMAHHGEEPAISGSKGSGTIFFAHCNMRCVYCQNYYFSQLDNGEEAAPGRLADMMLGLQRRGCHNINLVSPTHFMPQIVTALEYAVEKGLSIPIVYNTGGYELPEMIRSLDGVVDIYMPDMRYSDNAMAKRYSDAADYVEYNRAAVKEMQGQTGDLVLDGNGLAERGLIIRLLALPGGISGIKESLLFIRDHLSPNAYLSIMSQYYPTFRSHEYRELSGPVTAAEYENIVDEAKKIGLNNGWVQEKPAKFDPRFRGTNIERKTDIE
ncbi:MAG: radical SAM protein [Candidatus Omnitrophota bacterium]